MSILKNVAFAGASGALGSVVFKKLVDSGKFNIRVLTRPDSKTAFPAGTDVVQVDYTSVDSITAALQGQDAVLSTLTTVSGEAQTNLVNAAVAAGVKRFLPSEFGSNLDEPSVRKLPVFRGKVAVQDLLIEMSKTTDLSYTFVYNSAFLDWGLQQNFILKHSSPNPPLFDGGNTEFSTTTLASVGDAVVGVLTHPEETKNRAVYISDIITTQKRLLELAQKAAPEKSWNPVEVKLDDVTAKADERLAKGLYDMETFAAYLFRSLFDPRSKSKYEKTDNKLLGVKGVTEDDIVEILKPLLE